MADKTTALSIVLRTVDKATAKINAVSKRLDALTRPTRDFKKALSDLAEKSGFNAVLSGFRGVGSAIEGTLLKVAGIGFAVGEAAHFVLELIDKFAQLGHVAARAGVEADFLAGLRYAAQKSGASIEQLDQGVQTLTDNIGQMRAGTGRALKFLMLVSPALAAQFKASHGTSEALGLLADAMAKLPDAARRGALAQKLVGDPALAPLLARGSKGIQELMTRYAGLAGSQDQAVKSALEVHESMVDLNAVTDGLKAALVEGLAPSIRVVVDELAEWLTAHRDDVRQWAQDIGQRLPDAVHEVVKVVKDAAKWVSDFVRDIGGWKVAAAGLATAMAGPLVSSIATLSTALLTTPFGQFILETAAAVAALRELLGLMGMLDDREPNKVTAGGGIIGPLNIPQASPSRWQATAREPIGPRAAAARSVTGTTGIIGPIRTPTPPMVIPPELRLAPQVSTAPGQATIKVDFANAPKGTRVTQDPRNTVVVDTAVGYQLGGGL